MEQLDWLAHLLQLHTARSACSICGFVSFTAKVAAEPQSTGATGRRRLSSVILVPLSPATPCNSLRLLKTAQTCANSSDPVSSNTSLPLTISERWQLANVKNCKLPNTNLYKSTSRILVVFKSNIFLCLCHVYVYVVYVLPSCLSIWTQLAFPLADGLFTLGHKKWCRRLEAPNDFYQCYC